MRSACWIRWFLTRRESMAPGNLPTYTSLVLPSRTREDLSRSTRAFRSRRFARRRHTICWCSSRVAGGSLRRLRDGPARAPSFELTTKTTVGACDLARRRTRLSAFIKGRQGSRGVDGPGDRSGRHGREGECRFGRLADVAEQRDDQPAVEAICLNPRTGCFHVAFPGGRDVRPIPGPAGRLH